MAMLNNQRVEIKDKSSDNQGKSDDSRCVFPFLINIVSIILSHSFSFSRLVVPSPKHGQHVGQLAWHLDLSGTKGLLKGTGLPGGERAESDDVLGPCDENDRK